MKKTLLASALITTMGTSGMAWGATGLSFGDTVQLSANGGANKTKLVRMTSGRLVAVYGDYLNPEGNTVYDVKAQAERPARDIFARYCEAGLDCTVESNWSDAVNISETASKTSISTDWDGYEINDDPDGTRQELPFYGDSDKPNIFNAGSRVVVSWVDKYCDSEAQRSVTYLTLGNREIPFSCTYTVTSLDAGKTWSDPVRLSSGERDAKQDAHRGQGTGEWAITWQEDPRGLQLGEAEGPGDGASGANVSSGTDIWYSYANKGWADQDEVAEGNQIWSEPVRITDNYNGQTASGNFGIIRNATGENIENLEGVEIESGIAGASRANIALQYGSLDGAPVDDAPATGVPQVIVAYEETKGSGGLDEGKFVRYHTFDWNAPAGSTSEPNTADEAIGCIISDPLQNARRVRFVPQKEPGAASGLRLGIFWKEGDETQGGPSDIMLRTGIVNANGVTDGNGFSTAEMTPAVDATCATSDYLEARGLSHEPALNVSSRTEEAQATSNADVATSTLSDVTSFNNAENAIAHRAQLRGDDFYIGYTYTSVLAELLYTNTKNYNFYLRHYDAAAGTWSAPDNLSNITDTTINVREPRLVATPGTNTNACPTNPEECQDKTRFYIAWGTQTNVSEWSDVQAEELDLYAARAEDKGAYVTPVVRFAGEAEGVEAFESQIRMTPAGNNMFVAWNENRDGGTHAMFRQSSVIEIPDDDSGDDGDTPTATSSSGGGTVFGCSYSPGAPFDPTLFLLTALAIGGLTVRKVTAKS
ncbi:hypothetical protein SAMN04487881_0582 [Marinobacter sp. es.048]|uniref:choice-of-anchor O protein n=1 Tax=Marinobacter sp. es.048 TaxID=1761795 RepID=UPI000B58D377|nr:choice-of-anchor O protein [Marinobacter sp. es.048]SNC62049.1 hypothetical protein SAMN04487881_0582 [Marinobacter sp. es.048]